jgi:branched-chain amino acid transport system substrate-binding protein
MTGDMTRRPAAALLAAVSCLLAGAAQAQNSVKLGYAISKTGPNTGGASRRCR